MSWKPDPSSVKGYTTLVAELEAVRAKTESRVLHAVALRAQAHIAACVGEYAKLPEALNTYMDRIEAWVHESSTRNQDLADALLSQGRHLEKIEEPTWRRSMAEVGLALATVTRDQLDSQERILALHVSLVQLIAEISHKSLFEGVISSRDGERSIAAVSKFLEFLLGLTALGTFIDGITKIKEILGSRKAEIAAADKTLGYLESLSVAGFAWLASTHYVRRNVASRDQLITVEEAVKYADECVANETRRLAGSR